MTQTQFLKILHEDLKSEGIVKTGAETKKIMKVFIDCLKNEIVKGHSVPISEFGVFSSSLYNFKNIGFVEKSLKKKIMKFKVKFKVSKYVEDKLNEQIKPS